MRVRLFLGVSLALVSVLGAASLASAAGPTKLSGSVGPGFTISLKSATGKATTLKAGSYTFTVSDKSSIRPPFSAIEPCNRGVSI